MPLRGLTVIDALRRHRNVFADTSGVRRFDYLAAVARQSPGRLLFGSDGPWLHPGVELYKIRALGLLPDQEALVLGGNISRLMRHVRSEAPTGLARRAAIDRHIGVS